MSAWNSLLVLEVVTLSAGTKKGIAGKNGRKSISLVPADQDDPPAPPQRLDLRESESEELR